MSFNIDRKKVGGLSAGGLKLKVGKHAYEITAAEYLPNKSDPTGKEKQVVISLTDRDGTAKLYLAVNAANDMQSEIAQKTLVSLCEAVGYTGPLKPEALRKLVGGNVIVEARETAGKGASVGKTYVNVASIEACESDDEQEQEPEEEQTEEEETEEEESEEEEPAPAPKSGAKKKPWE
jgi:hypothetical protein